MIWTPLSSSLVSYTTLLPPPRHALCFCRRAQTAYIPTGQTAPQGTAQDHHIASHQIKSPLTPLYNPTTTATTTMRSVGALLFFLPFTSAFLAPTAPLPHGGRAPAATTARRHLHIHAATSSSSFVSRVQASSSSQLQQQQQRRQSRSSLNMVDQNIIYGGLVAFAGLAAGAGMVALTEKAGVRSEERGALSYEVSRPFVVVQGLLARNGAI